MILSFTANMAGPYHLDEGIPCQDSYWIAPWNGKFTVAACADGLGSEQFSDIGSRIAAKVAVEYCMDELSRMRGQVDFVWAKEIMAESFRIANNAIVIEANLAHNPSDQYDTTLCLAIYDGEHLFYGQSGDSGIVALLQSGEFLEVTEQQRDEEGNVFPLRFGLSYWKFGEVKAQVSALMIMTDGVLDQICPPIMKSEAIPINTSLAQRFLARSERSEESLKNLELASRDFLESYPRWLLDDDKTFVVLYNPDLPAKQLDPSYYAVPDWNRLYQKMRSCLYPNVDLRDSQLATSLDSHRGLDLKRQENGQSSSFINPDLINDAQEPLGLNEFECEAKKEIHLNNLSTEARNNENEVSKKENRFKRILSSLTIVLIALFSVLVILMRESIMITAPQGYVGLFLTTLLLNSTVLLPSSSIAVVISFSTVLNPIVVALIGALGATLGEMFGYFTGATVAPLASQILITRLKRRLLKHSFIVTVLFAILPLPLFDFVGVTAGTLQVNPVKFFLACLIGKSIKMIGFVWIASQLSNSLF